MTDTQKDLESYVLTALASMQKMGKQPGNIFIKTSPENISLIIRSSHEPIRFGDFTAITISHKDFISLGSMIAGIVKDQSSRLK